MNHLSITNIKKSKEARHLMSNFIWLLLLQLASYFMPLFVMPYLAKTIGVWGYGKIAFASAVILWVQTFTDWGFNYTSTRDVARVRDNTEQISRIFSETLWTRSLMAIMSLILLFILINFIPKFKENSLVLLVSYLLIPGHILCSDWFFQGMERMRYVTIINVIAKLVFTIAVFLFIHTKSQYYFQPLLLSFGYLTAGLISIYIIVYKWKIQIYKPCWYSIKKRLYYSKDVFLNELMPNLYNSFSIVLLGFWNGPDANGKLDAGVKFNAIGIQINSVISRSFFPLLSRKSYYHKYLITVQLLSSFSLSILTIIFAPFLIHIFFTPEFDSAIPAVRILAVSLIFTSLSNIYGTNYLIIHGYEKVLRNITIVASILGFALAFPLIYYWSFIGAALTITITRAMLGLSICIKSMIIKRRKTKIILN